MSVGQKKTRGFQSQRLMLTGVSWREYLRFLRAFASRRIRLTYDRGVLEIMTLSHEHESEGYIIARFVDVITEVLKLPVKGGRSTTFKKRKHLKGLEPDACWWIKNESQVRGKKKIDLKVDPAPDLALEIDISSSSIKRLPIYAALGVSEVWRFDGQQLCFLVLQENTEYKEVEQSVTFAWLKHADLLPFVLLHAHLDETSVVIQFREWVERVAQPMPGTGDNG